MDNNKIAEIVNYVIGLVGILYGIYSVKNKTINNPSFRIVGLTGKQFITLGYLGITLFLLLIIYRIVK